MPLFLAFTILFAIWMNHKIRKSAKPTMEKDDFWQLETKANFTRKADIRSLNYIDIPYESLPFLNPIPESQPRFTLSSNVEDAVKNEILSYERAILALKNKKILNLTGLSNTELKLKYGAANLPLLMQYDENFSKLSRTLAKWGKILFDIQETAAAQEVLEFAISCKSDIEDIFFTLATIYKSTHNQAGLSSLEAAAECFDEFRKENVRNRIKSI